jgi:hypothetical protein
MRPIEAKSIMLLSEEASRQRDEGSTSAAGERREE